LAAIFAAVSAREGDGELLADMGFMKKAAPADRSA
jgi:hypothetical protein